MCGSVGRHPPDNQSGEGFRLPPCRISDAMWREHSAEACERGILPRLPGPAGPSNSVRRYVPPPDRQVGILPRFYDKT
jgi:hypothetical protein